MVSRSTASIMKRSPEPERGLVDAGFAALLADPRMALRRCPPGVAFLDYRAAANRFMASAPKASIAHVEDVSAPGPVGPIAIRLYRSSLARPLPLILFAHGGGFLLGNLDTHDALCRTLANAAGAVVAAVDYRLAPEAAFPAPLDDMHAALGWLTHQALALGIDASRVALAGDSAGGQIAAATAIGTAPKAALFRHVGLFYPVLDPVTANTFRRPFGEGYMLTDDFLAWAWEAYGAGLIDRSDPRFDLARADPASFPPATIITAEFDPLRNEGEAFGARLSDAGIDCEVRCFEGMIHGFAGLPQFTGVAAEAISHVAARIRASFDA